MSLSDRRITDAYWNEMSSEFIERMWQSSVAINWVCKRFNAHMQLFIQMCILATFLPQFLLLHKHIVRYHLQLPKMSVVIRFLLRMLKPDFSHNR